MDNLIQLAKIFDNFIEIGNSFVHVDDIRAVRAVEVIPEADGIEVITPFGSYTDGSITFERFKENINLIRQTLQQANSKTYKSYPVTETGKKIQGDVSEKPTETVPKTKNDIKKKVTLIANIPIEPGQAGNCIGQLPLEAGYKIVDRQELTIQEPSGVVIGTGKQGGIIEGTIVSGIIFENGRYQLAFKGYSGSMAIAQYVVQGK